MKNLVQLNTSYSNIYPHFNQLSTSHKAVSESQSYSSNHIKKVKYQPSASSGNIMNPPQHREKFKQIVPRRKFTPEEDKKIKLLVEKLGTDSWDMIAEYMPDRSARQCRDRYRNYLLDYLCQDPWTCEEDQIIMSKFSKIGAHWVQIAKLLGRRSGNDVKNRWYKHLSKKYEQNMQEQHHAITKLDKDENQISQFQSFGPNEPKSSNFLLTSPHYQSYKTAQNGAKNELNENRKIHDDNLNIKSNSVNINKNNPSINQPVNCLNDNNTKFIQDSNLGNKNISLNHDTQLKNIECLNIFSNFDHEIAFDQADYSSYIDSFFS